MAGNRTPPPAAKPSQEWRGVAHRNLHQEWRGTNHTTHQPQPHHTPPPPGDLSQEWRGPPTTTGSETQPGVAGSSTREPPPGVARDQPHHTPATTPLTPPPLTTHHTPHTTHHTPRPAAEPQPGVAGNRTPPQAAKPSQEWPGVGHRNLRQEWRGTNHTTHQPQPHRHTTAAHHTPQTTHHTPTQTPRAHAPRHKHTHQRRTTTRGGGDTHTSNRARNSGNPPPPTTPPRRDGTPTTANRTAKWGAGRKGPTGDAGEGPNLRGLGAPPVTVSAPPEHTQ